MKATDRPDPKVLGALLRKQRQEGSASFAKGNFNVVGFAVRGLLTAALVAVFIVFFGDYVEIYLGVETAGAPDPDSRLFELLTIVYSAVALLTILSAVVRINRALFESDDMRVISALPVGANTVYVSKLIGIFGYQTIVSTICVLTVNGTIAAHADVGGMFWLVTVLTCLLLPLLSVGIASVLALPLHGVKTLLRDRFVLTFVVITVVTAVVLAAYAYLLKLVESMLLGEELRYFFNESVMNTIAAAAAWLYPANLLANLLVGREALNSALIIVAILVACLAVCLVCIRFILTRALKARISSGRARSLSKRPQKRMHSPIAALIKKEFVMIFRTPDYMFSYFSVALVVPLLVYFCMSIGSSLVTKLIGVSCNVELALFLSLMFGSLANVFCTTNISRDGMMFYSVKAMPVGFRAVVFSKVILCLLVAALSQLMSAILLCATGCIGVLDALFVLFVAAMFAMSQICFATRVDFDHAKFSQEPDGEIKEQSNTAGLVVVAGMLTAFAVGGSVVAIRMVLTLRGFAATWGFLTYLITGLLAVVAVVVGWLVLVLRLKERYYRFEGGAL